MALFKRIYRGQWVMQLGAEYRATDRVKLRRGYALAQNPINEAVGTTIGPIEVPGGIPAVKYPQSQFAIINEHRMAADDVPRSRAAARGMDARAGAASGLWASGDRQWRNPTKLRQQCRRTACSILPAMIEFDDFDAWADAVSGASLRLACDAAETRVWKLGIADLGGAVLQVASEGGGNLCYGANTHAGLTLFVPLSHAVEHLVNGEPLNGDALLAIPHGADFRICIRRRAHAWCSIALPADVTPWPCGTGKSERVTCPPAMLSRLREIVSTIAGSLLERPAGSPAHHAAGNDLVAAAVACLPHGRLSKPAPGRPRLERGDLIRRVMESLDAAAAMPTVAGLAHAVGVTNRMLLRTFQAEFGVPPKQYLMLRELHAVRRMLQGGTTTDETVADILVRRGIWEFGRFATRYRRQFGETPSETLRRTRG